MVFKNSIPQPGDSPATDSQADLLENFAQLNTQYGTAGDHVAWTAAADNGMHKQVSLNNVIADPNLPDPQVSLYTKTVTGDSELFFEKFDNGTALNEVRQMTNTITANLVNPGTAGGSLYRLDLPTGVTIYMGQTNGNGTVTFPVAYTVIYTSVGTRDTSTSGVAMGQGVGGLSLSGSIGAVNWLAIGTI
jgi:hypothetical protein